MVLTTLFLLCAASVVYGLPVESQPPRFTLEPQDAVLPTRRGSDGVVASLHCAHDSPNTTVTWYRHGTELITSDGTRTIHDNGTLEFHPLIANADLTEEGIEYHCRLSNAFGSVISRTAILKLATFADDWDDAIPANTMVDVTLGSSIYLPCDPPAANPPPVVEWLRGTTVVDTTNANKYKVLPSGGGLIIGNVDAADIGSPTYRCRVTNAEVFRTVDSPYTYQLNQVERYSENLTIFDTLQSRYELPLGSTAEFTCLATANDVNNLEIFYHRTDGNRLGDNTHRPQHDGNTIDSRTTLRITGITEANDGDYECVVRDLTSDGATVPLGRRNFTIVVTFPPTITTTPSDVVVYTGDSYTAQCGITGVPAPVISYFFNAMNITTGVPGVTVNNGALTLANVTHADTGPYQCFANNVRAINSALWVVTVRDPAAPLLLGKTSGSTYVTMNTNLTLTVDVSADPQPVTTWQLDGGDLPALTTTTLRVMDEDACPKTYQAQLTVVGFTADHSGIYTVTIENRAGMITEQFERRVEEPAAVTSLTGTGAGGKCIVLGMDSALTCTYTGVPTATPLWYRGTGDARVNIPFSDAKYVVVYTITTPTTELTIRNVASEDAGIYGCEATNSVNGSTLSHSLEIEFVICTNPTFITPDATEVTVTNMRNVTLNCKGEGEPEVTYEWLYVNDSGIRVDPVDGEHILMGVEADTGVHYIKIIEATEDDEGTYICKITTELGTAESTFTLVVEPGVPPSPTLMESNSSDSSITVTWDMPMDIDIDHYRIEYRVKVDQSDWVAVLINATLTSYEIMGLSPLTTYEVRIFAISTEGVSSVAANAISITTEAQLPVMIEGETTVNEGGRLELTCLLSDGGVPYDPQWRKDSGNLPDHVIVGSTNGHVLMISSVSSSDAGEYTCTNGESSDTVNVAVNNRVPPPITPMESDSSDSSITVTWDMPMDIDTDHYRIEYRVKVNQSDWVAVMVNATLTSYEIMGLSPWTTYEVRIFAISTEGVSSVAADVISVTTEAKPPVMIEGETTVNEGGILELTCLLSDGGFPYDPQWRKGLIEQLSSMVV